MKTTSKNMGNGIDADVSGNRLPFKSQSINNFCGIDISQPTPSESLSVPLFSLGNIVYIMYFISKFRFLFPSLLLLSTVLGKDQFEQYFILSIILLNQL